MNICELLENKDIPTIIIPLSYVSEVSKRAIDTYTQKGAFVTKELSAILQKIDNSIVGASYVVTEYRSEYVRVHYEDGSYYDKNVTADSLGILAIEIIERII